MAKAKQTTKKKIVNKSGSKKVAEKKAVKKITAKKAVKKITAKKAAKKATAKKAATSKKTYKGEEAFLASINPYKLTKNEKYMSAKQRKHFLAILTSWKEQLEFEQDKTASKIQTNNNNFADDSDRATHEEGFALEIRTRDRERKLLSKIKESIEQLKSNDYGYCYNPYCGVEIGIRRLEARPTATLCIDCKNLQEIEEKQKYG
tara:strand:- start:650 stop:1261 length:612 start_codon:yes stop_codon:yes gene_type:complete